MTISFPRKPRCALFLRNFSQPGNNRLTSSRRDFPDIHASFASGSESPAQIPGKGL
jgi:hypothetical protein